MIGAFMYIASRLFLRKFCGPPGHRHSARSPGATGHRGRSGAYALSFLDHVSQLLLSLFRDRWLPLRSWSPFFSSSTRFRFLSICLLCCVGSAMGNVSHFPWQYSQSQEHHADPTFLPFTGRKGSAETREECCEGGSYSKEPDEDQSGCHEHRLPDVQASIRTFVLAPFTVGII